MQRGDDIMTNSIAILDILTLCNIGVSDGTIIQDVSVDIGLIRFLFFDKRGLSHSLCWCMMLKLEGDIINNDRGVEVVYATIKCLTVKPLLNKYLSILLYYSAGCHS